MMPDKEIKKKFQSVFWKNPEKYYPVEFLKQEGFERKTCSSCHKPFWSTTGRTVCGDPGCSKEFGFIGKSPAKNSLGYVEVWTEFAKMFEKFGYTPIKRYPVVARWNPTMEYTNASIAAFQPYVISGEISPPANPLVIPQFCLRFGDVDNVGITGSHNTGFIMIGQHMFVPPEDWNQNKVFEHIHTWVMKGIGLPKKEVTYHEDSWAGGGNFGCCMEFFSRGCELGNQVYMLYEQTATSHKELGIKVLDMGMGQERNAWFTQGTNTMYDAVFPTVLKRLKRITGIKVDNRLMKKYVPHSGLLNLDEVGNINTAWKMVAAKAEVPVDELKKQILPMAALYSVAEHSRSLLFALADGALPSNVGGGYNLRMILRRALSFIDKYGWDISLNEVCDWHADYLKKIFPELKKGMNEVNQILNVEKKKYYETKKKNQQVIIHLLKKDVSEQKLLELYDSHGITPNEVLEEAKKKGKRVFVPDNFYARVSDRHEKAEQKTQTKKEINLDLKGLDETETLYFANFDMTTFEGVVLRIIDNYIILNRTGFYPTSGGQIHDLGTLNGQEVVDVFKQGNIIVHVMKEQPKFKKGDSVKGDIDIARRLQLAQHHTGTHILNGAAKRILGNHIWQAGAAKFIDKARLDITHFDQLSNVELEKIENLANEIINKNIPILKTFLARDVAEARYGFTIYQGGAVPGKRLRIVSIEGFDTEACGGTHLNLTGECKVLKILKSTKVQDGIIRLEFVCGEAAFNQIQRQEGLLFQLSQILHCKDDEVYFRIIELFEKWKTVRKSIKKNQPLSKKEITLLSTKKFEGDTITSSTEALRTQPEHLVKTVQRFLDDLSKATVE